MWPICLVMVSIGAGGGIERVDSVDAMVVVCGSGAMLWYRERMYLWGPVGGRNCVMAR